MIFKFHFGINYNNLLFSHQIKTFKEEKIYEMNSNSLSYYYNLNLFEYLNESLLFIKLLNIILNHC